MTTGAAKLCAVVATVAALVVGCGSKTPDYQSIWTTSSTTTPSAPPEDPTPLPEYLQSIGVSGQPVAIDELPDLTVSIPTPSDWVKPDSDKLAPGTLAISKGEPYPLALLTVFHSTATSMPPT